MRKRKLLLGALAGLAVVLAATVDLLMLFPPAPHKWTRQDFAKIQPGMTLAEIEAALGDAPGDYTSRRCQIDNAAHDPASDEFRVGMPVERWTEESWVSDTGIIGVIFDASGRASFGSYCPVRPDSRSSIDDLRWRFRRLWRRWFPSR